MKILVIGAGAVGGYFGGRLLEAGRDVTFLVRPGRAARLAEAGLMVRSRFGDLDIHNPPTVQAEALHDHVDLILLSCKAYDLDDAIDSFAAAVGPATVIVPLLNGMRHLEVLERRFGATAVMGGQCLISSTLDAEGRIVHLNDVHALSFGERDGAVSARARAIAAAFAGARFDDRLSESILQEMWEKFVFIAALAGMTCLMRGSIGDIVQAGGGGLAVQLLEECAAIAGQEGFPLRPAAFERSLALFKMTGSPMTASMLRDIEANNRTESETVLGDLVRRGERAGLAVPMLRTAYTHLATYEARRGRLLAAH
jgi:2-dehydropantoate 2-reductase